MTTARLLRARRGRTGSGVAANEAMQSASYVLGILTGAGAASAAQAIGWPAQALYNRLKVKARTCVLVSFGALMAGKTA